MKTTQLWVQLVSLDDASAAAPDNAPVQARWCLMQHPLHTQQQGSLVQLVDWLHERNLPDAGGLHTVLLMSGDMLVTRQLTFLAKERKHLQRMLPFMLEPELAADVSQVHVAHGQPRVTGESGQVSVAYIDKKTLQAAIQTLEDMGLELEEIYAIPAALPASQSQWTLLVDGDVCHVHAGSVLCASVEHALVLPLLEAALAEQGKTHTPQCLQVLVSSAEQTSPALQQLYQSLLDHPGILKSGVRVTQQSIQQVWSELILQGDDLVNVRQGEFAAPLRIAKYWKPLRTPVIAAMLAVCAVVGSVFVETTINQRRFQALENQVQQRYREVMPDGVLVDAAQQLTTQLTRFRAVESTPGPVTMLNAMLDAFESAGNLNLHRLSYSSSDQNSSEIQMSISAPTTAEILELSEKLGVGGWTAQAQNITRAGDLQQANLIVRGNGF
ncbi:MAG: type II secretion system protein GspL [Pseudohongiella sp.]|nr:type II secretion system protein GspL [Pseudohongiella sp.]